MEKFNSTQMNEFWKEHDSVWSGLDRKKDRYALTNVCYNGAPLWYNKYYDFFQRRTFRRLFKNIKINNGKSLDIGCGGGRWCELLNKKGYDAYGIDLQHSTIELDKKIFPNIHFFAMDASELKFKDDNFDIVSSVTVIQHIPLDKQEKVLDEISRVIKKHGYFIFIEDVKDESIHVFPRKYNDWVKAIESRGFKLIKALGSDYTFFNKLFDVLVKPSARNLLQTQNPKDYAKNMSLGKKKYRFLYYAYYTLKFPIILVSYPFEYLFEMIVSKKQATCGAFLFQKID